MGDTNRPGADCGRGPSHTLRKPDKPLYVNSRAVASVVYAVAFGMMAIGKRESARRGGPPCVFGANFSGSPVVTIRQQYLVMCCSVSGKMS